MEQSDATAPAAAAPQVGTPSAPVAPPAPGCEAVALATAAAEDHMSGTEGDAGAREAPGHPGTDARGGSGACAAAEPSGDGAAAGGWEQGDVPPSIKLKCQPFDIAFHPHDNIVAVSLISGAVRIYRFTGEGNELLHGKKVHAESCRAISFNHEGDLLFTASRDKSVRVVDVETGSLCFSLPDAHPDPINAMTTHGGMIFTGDDEGRIRVWDVRQKKMLFDWHEHHDYITNFLYRPGPRMLVAAGADGCLSAWNIRKGDVDGISANLDDEVLSLDYVAGSREVVCGTQSGRFHAFEWGCWEEPVDSHRGHPGSIDSLAAIGDNLVAIGGSDGIVRIVTVHPYENIAMIGEHYDFPVERLRLSPGRALLATASHDNVVRFWDVSELLSPRPDADADGGDDDDREPATGRAAAAGEALADVMDKMALDEPPAKRGRAGQHDQGEAEVEGDDDDDDDGDDDAPAAAAAAAPQGGKHKPKGKGKKKKKGFFGGL
eukprot:m51a1_g10016 putative wd g-beta repeat-containing protein (490) ;mRNA; f:65857-67660